MQEADSFPLKQLQLKSSAMWMCGIKKNNISNKASENLFTSFNEYI